MNDMHQQIHDMNPYEPWHSGCTCEFCVGELNRMLGRANRERDKYQSRLIQAEIELVSLRRKAAMTDLLMAALNGTITMKELALLPVAVRTKIWSMVF